jgi:hypothetical protein
MMMMMLRIIIIIIIIILCIAASDQKISENLRTRVCTTVILPTVLSRCEFYFF